MDFMRQEKPKPPTRRRKKFQTPEDATEADNQSNGKSLTDGIPESEDIGDEKQVITQTEGDTTGNLTNQNAEKQSTDPEEAWEVIPDISVENETTQEPAKLEKQASLESPKLVNQETSRLPKQISLDSQNGDVLTNETFEEAVRALSFKKKKKPPPLRPAPYTERTPPLPPKKRKTVHIVEHKGDEWNQIAEEASTAAASRAIMVEADEGQEEIEQGEEATEHLYEVIDPRDLR